MGHLVKSIRPKCPVLYFKGRTVFIQLVELNQEGSAWFIIYWIYTKIIPGQPLIFWVRYRYNEALGSKKQQVSRPHRENGAPKAAR